VFGSARRTTLRAEADLWGGDVLWLHWQPWLGRDLQTNVGHLTVIKHQEILVWKITPDLETAKRLSARATISIFLPYELTELATVLRLLFPCQLNLNSWLSVDAKIATLTLQMFTDWPVVVSDSLIAATTSIVGDVHHSNHRAGSPLAFGVRLFVFCKMTPASTSEPLLLQARLPSSQQMCDVVNFSKLTSEPLVQNLYCDQFIWLHIS
jgi:hypothetical protein